MGKFAMVALHLIPVHRALAVRFHAIGWEGQYSFAPMFLDGNRWFSAGEGVMAPREKAEESGSALQVGDVHFFFEGEDVVIQNKGLPFGRCNAAAYARALEGARAAAAKRVGAGSWASATN